MAHASTPLDDLLEFLRRSRGFDFTGYKRSTLERRIRKRMATVGAEDYARYLDLLQVRADEFEQLFNTVLINVTGFFRDPDVWDLLRTETLPKLLEAKDPKEPIRAWSAGCSSGEEAYTIAILFAELLGEVAYRRVKVYATDVDEHALTQARRATYSARDLEALPEGFRDKYFLPVSDQFELRSELRRCAIFGRHDLIYDAPISRNDLIACRNALMYLNADTQERILQRVHFALNEGAVLVLGKAETLLSHGNLFTPVNAKRRVFLKNAVVEPRIPSVRHASRAEVTSADMERARLRETALDGAPVAQVVVGLDGTLVLASQLARDTLGLSPRDVGRPLQDLEISYRPAELRSLIERAYSERRAVVLKNVERPRPGETFYCDVHVTPLFDSTGSILGTLATFLDVTQTTRLQQKLHHSNEEFEAALEELQSTGEELETTNEELQSTIEELETTNEELQATGEELETMNEELQSTNEELHALNDELRERSDQLEDANRFLETVIGTLRTPVIVIDRDLAVKAWNASAQDLWGLRPEEVVGKSLMGLDIGLPVEKLGAPLRTCFAGNDVGEIALEAVNRRGRPIKCRVTCSRLDGDGDARGAVLVIGTSDESGRG